MNDILVVFENRNDQGEWESHIRFEIPDDSVSFDHMNIYKESKKPWQGSKTEYEGTSDHNKESSDIKIKVEDTVNFNVTRFKELVNNHLDICMSGYKIKIVNSNETYLLKWIDENTPRDISENYLGYFDEVNNEIYIEKPSLSCTPIIFIHELLHTLDLHHRSGGDQNIMGNDFLTTNYKISTEQVTVINDQDAIRTIDESILPPNQCVVLNI